MNYTEEQFNKLPKWAQSEIRVLEMRNRDLKETLQEYEGKAETNTYLITGMDKTPLPNNAHVEFHSGQDVVSVYIQKDGTIDVNANGSGEMVILPRAANSFYIKFV